MESSGDCVFPLGLAIRVPRPASASMGQNQMASALDLPEAKPSTTSRGLGGWSLLTLEQTRAAGQCPRRLSLSVGTKPGTTSSSGGQRRRQSSLLTPPSPFTLDAPPATPSPSADAETPVLRPRSSSIATSSVFRPRSSSMATTVSGQRAFAVHRAAPCVVPKPASRADRAFRRSFRTSQFGSMEPLTADTVASCTVHLPAPEGPGHFAAAEGAVYCSAAEGSVPFPVAAGSVPFPADERPVAAGSVPFPVDENVPEDACPSSSSAPLPRVKTPSASELQAMSAAVAALRLRDACARDSAGGGGTWCAKQESEHPAVPAVLSAGCFA